MKSEMTRPPAIAEIALTVVIACGLSLSNAKAQSLTAAPHPSSEMSSQTKALAEEWSRAKSGNAQ